MLDFFQCIQWHFFQNRDEIDFSWAGSWQKLVRFWSLLTLYPTKASAVQTTAHPLHHMEQGWKCWGGHHVQPLRYDANPMSLGSGTNSLTCCVETKEERAGHREGQHPHSCNHECHTPTGALPGSVLIVNWHDHRCVPVKEYGWGEAGWEPQVKEVCRGWLIPKQMTREKTIRWRELRKVFDPRGRHRKNGRAGWWGGVLWNPDIWAWYAHGMY